MKPLSDLISQITDEKSVQTLTRLLLCGDGWIHLGGNITICNINISENMIDHWKGLIKYYRGRIDFHNGFCNEVASKKIRYLRKDIRNLKSITKTAYFYVLQDGRLVTFIDSAEKCLEFFGEGKG